MVGICWLLTLRVPDPPERKVVLFSACPEERAANGAWQLNVRVQLALLIVARRVCELGGGESVSQDGGGESTGPGRG